MAYERLVEESLDYYPCRYGNSKLLFRGPRSKLDEDFIAFLGGSETYGKYVEQPFSDLTGSALGMTSVNLGCVNAGIDVFNAEEAVWEVCSKAKLTVVQVMGAQNMSNRLYSVHPRRNDRFLKASKLMGTIYREVDFTEFHFTRHLLTTLLEASEQKFELVRDELKEAWVARMKRLLGKTGRKTVLLWISDRRPEGASDILGGSDPLFVDREMLEQLSGHCAGVIEVVASPEAIAAGTKGMVFSEVEANAASELPGPARHTEIAQALAAQLPRYLD